MVQTNLSVRDATVDDLKYTDEVVDIINSAYRSEGRRREDRYCQSADLIYSQLDI